MATQTGTLKAGYQLVIDSQGASVDYDVSVTGYAVDFKRIQQKNTLSLGPHKVDCTYSVTVNSGSPSIYKVQPNGQREYTAETLPDPNHSSVGDSFYSDGGLNVQSRGEFTPVRADANSLAVVGDSFTANALFKSATTEEWSARGYLTQAISLSNGRMNIAPGGMCAVGGSGITANINGVKLDTQLTSAIATGAKNLLVMGGINDCNSDVDPLVTFKAYKALVNRAVSAGLKVWVATQPCQSSTFVTYTVARQGAQLKLQDLMRQWCRTQSPNNVVLIDSAQACIDPASATASYLSGYTTDNLHPNNKGAYYLGKYIATAWNKHVPLGCELVSSNADNVVFSPLSTNVQSNSLMIANTAGLATGFTTAVGGSAVVGSPSVASRADGIGSDQVVPLTFSAANDWGRLLGSTYATFNDGDSFYMECEVTITSPVAVRGVRGTLQVNGNLVTRTAVVNQRDDATDVAYSEGMTYILRTPIIKYEAEIQGATHNLQAHVTVSSSGAGSCTLKVGRFAIKKVSV